MSAREQIFANLKDALENRSTLAARNAAADARINAHPSSLIPVRGQTHGADRITAFISEAELADAEVVRLESAEQIPSRLKQILGDQKSVRAAPHPLLQDLDWASTSLDVAFGRADPHDAVGLSVALAGIAETGTLVLHTGPKSPVTLNFLPDTHIVAIHAKDIEGAGEDVWKRLRHEGKALGRTLNWITGPSRTADIEQSLLLGAHGPRRLVILLIDGEKDSPT